MHIHDIYQAMDGSNFFADCKLPMLTSIFAFQNLGDAPAAIQEPIFAAQRPDQDVPKPEVLNPGIHGHPQTDPDQGNCNPETTANRPKRGRGRSRKDDKLRRSSTSRTSDGSRTRRRRRRSNDNDWPSWLPPDWQILTNTRKNGVHAGQIYKTYMSPGGKRFRSKPEVLNMLNRNTT